MFAKLLCSAAIIVCCAPLVLADALPKVGECRLRVGGAVLTPVRVQDGWQVEHEVGSHRIAIRENVLVELDKQTGKALWETKASDNAQLVWIANSKRIVCFLGRKSARELEDPPIVRRLDLDKLEWLTPLPITSPDKAKAGQRIVVNAVLPEDDGSVVVLHHLLDKDIPESYFVSLFPRTGNKPVWSIENKSAGNRPESGAYLLAARYPDYASSSIRHLSRNGDTIILCAGPKDDLVCRAMKDGKQEWRVPHVWEFERSFVGPSVWQHFIGRADSSPLSVKQEFPDPRVERPLKASEKPEGPPKKAEAGTTESAIIGGPIVFNSRVFVAVSKAPSDTWAGYLGQCWVYELEAAGGSPVSLTAIPRAVLGGQHEPAPDGLVWACHGGCFLKLNIVQNAMHMGMGPGGPDRLSNVVWYRGIQPNQPAAWLSADPAADAIAWQRKYVFRTIDGGYISKAGDTLYHFPISVVDTKTGLDRVVELTVPLTEAVTPPKSNYSSNGSSYKVMGPRLVGITGLEAGDSSLRICLGSGSKANGIEFSLRQIEAELNKGK